MEEFNTMGVKMKLIFFFLNNETRLPKKWNLIIYYTILNVSININNNLNTVLILYLIVLNGFLQ